jgi:hypothetical protein
MAEDDVTNVNGATSITREIGDEEEGSSSSSRAARK